MKKLTVATSSAALFDLEQSDRVYKEEGLEAYSKYQRAREQEPLAPGRAFSLITVSYTHLTLPTILLV